MVVHRITVELKNPHGLVVLQHSTLCVCGDCVASHMKVQHIQSCAGYNT